MRLWEEPDAPLPAFAQAWELEGSLEDAVERKTSALGNPRRSGATIFVDGTEEAGRAARLLIEARVLAHTWPETAVVIASRPISELDVKDEKVPMRS